MYSLKIECDLLVNAGIHSFYDGEEGTVTITGSKLNSERVKFEEIDDGKRMDETLVATVFNPFVTKIFLLHRSHNADTELLLNRQI